MVQILMYYEDKQFLLIQSLVVIMGNVSGANGTDINVVSGHSATLPCDTKQSSTREQPSLILWFKEEDGKPIFR